MLGKPRGNGFSSAATPLRRIQLLHLRNASHHFGCGYATLRGRQSWPGSPLGRPFQVALRPSNPGQYSRPTSKAEDCPREERAATAFGAVNSFSYSAAGAPVEPKANRQSPIALPPSLVA